jgi:enoyl-CoA hydratase
MERPPLKPIIAAIEGHAYAGGLELTLSCDLVVASSETQFALTEVKWSLVAVGGGVLRLPRRIPYHIAMEMILTAQPKSAPELAAYGLVNRVTAPGETYAAALELARLVVANAPLAVQSSKECVWRNVAEQWSEADGWENQKAPLRRVVKSKDYTEGLKSFAEKRPAAWTGA